MNLAKMFKTQRKFDERVMQEHPELKDQNNLDWKIIALQVELGECANEWRGFKKWSHDQKPRTWKREGCKDCEEKGYRIGNPPHDKEKGIHGLGNHWYYCDKCAGYFVINKNPLLEEYVDCLSFVLTIGLEIGADNHYEDEVNFNIGSRTKKTDPLDQFQEVFQAAALFDIGISDTYLDLFHAIATLGDSLGFYEREVEEAYFAKSAVNHQRQEDGY